MAGLKEIKRRLASVNNTKKITYAMKLVAAAKLRKVQEEVVGFRRYRASLYDMHEVLKVAFDSSLGQEDLGTDLLSEERDVNSVCLLIVGGFRGLAGGYNTNVSKAIDATLKNVSQKYPGAAISAVVLGKKACEHLRKRKIRIEKSYEKLPDVVSKWPLAEVVDKVVADYRSGDVDKTFLIFTEFRSALSQHVNTLQLLPFSAEAGDVVNSDVVGAKKGPEKSSTKPLDVISEPSIKEVLAEVVQRMVKAELLYASLNAQASEHGSRMTAMDAATKNASDLVDRLRLTYNKLRQSGITAELLDIIGGAEAIR
jgi:F-type H+-transporting ATPase subunit gamma